jgi:DNA-binding SARP family transcriptional activator
MVHKQNNPYRYFHQHLFLDRNPCVTITSSICCYQINILLSHDYHTAFCYICLGDAMMSPLEIRCFGLLQVKIQNESLHNLDSSPGLRALLGYLILHREQSVSRSQVAGLFWPDVPETQARRALNNLLWRLRGFAGGLLIANLRTTRYTLCWQLPAGAWLDLAEFETLTGMTGRLEQDPLLVDAETLAMLEQSIPLYRGSLLEDCDAEWCHSHRLRYQERFTQTVQALLTGYEQIGALEKALHYANHLVCAEPYHEPGYEAMACLHLALDQPQAAIEVYEQYRQLWHDELGLPPSAEMQRLLHMVKQTSRSLDTAYLAVAVSTQFMQMIAQEGLPAPLSKAVRQSSDTLHQVMASEATGIGAVAEAEYAWEVAHQAYQVALTALDMLPAGSGRFQQQYEIHLRCDSLYDRLSRRPEQVENLAQALYVARELADPALQSEVRARQCWVALEQCRLPQAIDFGEMALRLAGQACALRAQALRLLGSSHELLGRYPKAAAYHQEALALDSGNPEMQRLDHINLASVYTQMAADWLALTHVRSALANIPENPPTLARLCALGHLGNIERELGLFQTAATHLQTAQKMAGILGDRALTTWLAVRAAVLYRETGELDRARLWAAKGWRGGCDLNHPRFAVEAALELARLAYCQSGPTGARPWLDKAGALIKETALFRYQGATNLLWVLFYLETGSFEAAATIIKEILATMQAAGDSRYLALAYTFCSMVASRQGDDDSARQQFKLARQVLQQRAERIPTAVDRGHFQQATPFRRLLFHSNQRQSLAAASLWLA